MIDSHCHLTDERLLSQLPDVLDRAQRNNVTRMITIGTGIEDARAAVAICQGRSNLRCAVGIHPNYCHEYTLADVEQLREIQNSPAVVALGEMGLDYFHKFAPPAHQAEMFEAQLRLARELDRPVVIHCREAIDDALAIMRNYSSVPGVFHCFTGSTADAEKIIAAGYSIGFTGALTFKKSTELREIAKTLPAERILIETDSPYLSPEPMRKQKTNEPSLVVHVADVLAAARDMTRQQIDELTSINASRLFRWPL